MPHIDANTFCSRSPATAAAPAGDAGRRPDLGSPIDLHAQPIDRWNGDDAFPRLPRTPPPRLGTAPLSAPLSDRSSAGSYGDLVALSRAPRVASPTPSRPLSALTDASLAEDLLATHIEDIIARQSRGPQEFAQVLAMCRELLALGDANGEVLAGLFTCAELNLPLFCLLACDTATFELLNRHNLAFVGDNHFVFQVYGTIPGAESAAVCDYFDSQIVHLVASNNIDAFTLPRHVIAFVRALSIRNDARYLVYLCQDAKVAAQCALLADNVALAARVMREPAPNVRTRLFFDGSNASSPSH